MNRMKESAVNNIYMFSFFPNDPFPRSFNYNALNVLKRNLREIDQSVRADLCLCFSVQQNKVFWWRILNDLI